MMERREINQRARGWLRFIWDKATTEDDWSSNGDPHQWWDKTSTAPMCAFPRFDLSETSYALPLLVDQTPAWREIYTRIADELVGLEVGRVASLYEAFQSAVFRAPQGL